MYQKLQRLASEPDFFVGTNHNYPGRVFSSANRDFSNRYAKVHWNAAAMMAVPKDHAEGNPYWKPPKKPAPCYTYTREEVDALNKGTEDK
jgi:hypothetical protein